MKTFKATRALTLVEVLIVCAVSFLLIALVVGYAELSREGMETEEATVSVSCDRLPWR
jgi:competence protein ComGC